MSADRKIGQIGDVSSGRLLVQLSRRELRENFRYRSFCTEHLPEAALKNTSTENRKDQLRVQFIFITQLRWAAAGFRTVQWRIWKFSGALNPDRKIPDSICEKSRKNRSKVMNDCRWIMDFIVLSRKKIQESAFKPQTGWTGFRNISDWRRKQKGHRVYFILTDAKNSPIKPEKKDKRIVWLYLTRRSPINSSARNSV